MSPYITYAERLMRPLAEQLAREQEKIRNIADSVEKRLIATSVRKRVHKRLEEQLKAAYPEQFAVKQSGPINKSTLHSYWRIYVVPEIESYIHGIDYYSLIATLHSHNRIDQAIIYFPQSRMVLTGSNGAGAYYDQRRLRIRHEFESSETFIACNATNLSGWRRELVINSKRLVHTGSTFGDLLYLLTGKVDTLLVHNTAQPIMELLEFFVRESGGFTASVELSRTIYSCLAASSYRLDQLRMDYSIQST